MADEERDEKSRNIKVTDRRMFTPDGKLKEEYRWLEDAEAPAGASAGGPAAPAGEADASAREAVPGGGRPAAGVSTAEELGAGPEAGSTPRVQAAPETAAAPQGAAAGTPVQGGTPASGPAAEAAPGGSAPRGPAGQAEQGSPGTPLELPDTPDSMGKPGFLDLLAVLAEPATIYLGDAALPDGRQTEDLRAARLYIDLLTVLRDKTNGNLSAQERVVMDDLLYRLQMRYIEKRG